MIHNHEVPGSIPGPATKASKIASNERRHLGGFHSWVSFFIIPPSGLARNLEAVEIQWGQPICRISKIKYYSVNNQQYTTYFETLGFFSSDSHFFLKQKKCESQERIIRSSWARFHPIPPRLSFPSRGRDSLFRFSTANIRMIPTENLQPAGGGVVKPWTWEDSPEEPGASRTFLFSNTVFLQIFFRVFPPNRAEWYIIQNMCYISKTRSGRFLVFL